MKKINPDIRENMYLTMQERIDMIEMIADVYFRRIVDEQGNEVIKYTPYLEEVGKVNAIMRFFITGVEIEDNEDVYDEVMNDAELSTIVDRFLDDGGYPFSGKTVFDDIMEEVHDVVEYRKQENLARIQNESNAKIAEKISELIDKEIERNEKDIETADNLNNWVAEQRELNSLITPEMQKNFAENFDMDALMDKMMDKYSESKLSKRNEEVVENNRKIREQENTIIELQSALKREKQKENVKNVLADNGNKPKKE